MPMMRSATAELRLVSGAEAFRDASILVLAGSFFIAVSPRRASKLPSSSVYRFSSTNFSNGAGRAKW
jgi:hypothetical protein